MPALSFMAKFVPMIVAREKYVTLRAPRKGGRHARVGETLSIYTGMRTKQCRLIGKSPVVASYPFTLSRISATTFGTSIDTDYSWHLFALPEIDGFASKEAFIAHFFPTATDHPLHLQLIAWCPNRLVLNDQGAQT